jgi:hypothetical protein
MSHQTHCQASSSRDRPYRDRAMELYHSLLDEDHGTAPSEVLESIFRLGGDRDRNVTVVMSQLLKYGSVEAVDRMFALLKDGEGCGLMQIRRPNRFPHTCFMSWFWSPRSDEVCQTFVDWGLDLDERWSFVSLNGEVKSFDLWLWAAATSAVGIAERLTLKDVVPDVDCVVSSCQFCRKNAADGSTVSSWLQYLSARGSFDRQSRA